ncbi:4364_t:CDS:2, partial [Entrophospora sp. SA101]
MHKPNPLFPDSITPSVINKPVEFNNPTYTYLNLIVDRAFTDPNTEKNYIAFGVTVTLNYLDPSKDINLVQNE